MADYKESDPFYHTAAWKRARQAALMRDHGMCRECMDRMRAGIGVRPNRATMVHHVIPRSERPDLELVLDNLISLCPLHHRDAEDGSISRAKLRALAEHPPRWSAKL